MEERMIAVQLHDLFYSVVSACFKKIWYSFTVLYWPGPKIDQGSGQADQPYVVAGQPPAWPPWQFFLFPLPF